MDNFINRMQQNADQRSRDLRNQQFQRQENQKQLNAFNNMSRDLQRQALTQEQMTEAIYSLVMSQNESNKIIQSQCDELKRQNELLQEQNISQTKELKKQRIWNWITYGITTVIAIASVVGTFISAFK